MSYFVILRGQNGRPLPMVDDENNIALFDTEDEAEECASENPLGSLFGFETIEWE